MESPPNTEINTFVPYKDSLDDKINRSLKTFVKQSTTHRTMNQEKVESESFFQLLSQLMLERLPTPEFNAKLENIAKRAGFQNGQDALNRAVNQSGQTPLAYALDKQDFHAANHLLDNGARVTPVEKASFDVARDSKAGRAYGLPPIPAGQPLPNVKYFGLALGINMISRDGISSQFAQIGPANDMMADSVTSHANRHPKNPHFKEIGTALTTANNSAKFVNCTPQGSGKSISNSIQRGQTTAIPVSCQGSAMGLSFVADKPPAKSGYLVFTNKGATPSDCGTSIYRITDSTRITPDFVNRMINGHNNGTSQAAIVSAINGIGGKPIGFIPQKGINLNNPTAANIHGILLCMRAREVGGFENLTDKDREEVKREFKEFTSEMRLEKSEELAAMIKRDPHNQDLQDLAKAYLEQNTSDTPANREIRAPLEKALRELSPGISRNQRG